MISHWNVSVAGNAVFAYQLVSRLAYVGGVGVALRAEERRKAFTGPHGTDAGFRRFRRIAAALMYNDAVAFVVLCVVTRNSMTTGMPRVAVLTFGALLAVIGTGVKIWAAAGLGTDAFFWRNFFEENGSGTPSAAGPYRFLKNPMYTVGYLQTYGLALFFASVPGLIASVFDHIAIMMFFNMVEKPHFASLDRTTRWLRRRSCRYRVLRSPSPSPDSPRRSSRCSTSGECTGTDSQA